MDRTFDDVMVEIDRMAPTWSLLTEALAIRRDALIRKLSVIALDQSRADAIRGELILINLLTREPLEPIR